MGIQGGILADALAADFATPPPPPPDPPPESQAEILARAGALIGLLTPGSLRMLEETLLDALQSAQCIPAPAHFSQPDI
jgi:hypothetical protein